MAARVVSGRQTSTEYGVLSTEYGVLRKTSGTVASCALRTQYSVLGTVRRPGSSIPHGLVVNAQRLPAGHPASASPRAGMLLRPGGVVRLKRPDRDRGPRL